MKNVQLGSQYVEPDNFQSKKFFDETLKSCVLHTLTVYVDNIVNLV